MIEFFSALGQHAFLQNAVIAGLLASVSCGLIGSYVVVKKIVFISGGIAHTVLGGMGVAYFFGFNPLYGAVVSAILAALIIGLVSLNARQNEDTIIGALWAFGMAVGIIFIYQTPGYNEDLMIYLFGNILLVPQSDILLLGILDVGLIVAVLLLYKRFLAVCFDDEFAALQGVRVKALYLLLLCMIALTVVILIRVVGIILVIALLTLPAAIAGHYVSRLSQMMVISIVLGAVFTLGGLILSYGPDLPSGAVIIILASVTYMASLIVKSVIFQIRYKNSIDRG
jgi:zinc transport system permease protein